MRTPSAAAGLPWTVVLPFKGGPQAKSRLGGPPGLALAIAADCLDAVTACPDVTRVIVVSSDRQVAELARSVDADLVPERRPGAGLAAALRDGIRAAADRPGPVALLLGDLPALRPSDLRSALRAVTVALDARLAASMAMVPDTEGSGTVMLAGRDAAHLDPAFGPGSAAEHVRRGAIRLDLALPRLRRDVDTPDDLATALALGCGRHTSRRAPGTPAATRHYPGAVQATVQTFDPNTLTGNVVTDSGLVLPFSSDAFATGGLRMLRPGQRVSLSVAGEPEPTEVTELWLEAVGYVPSRAGHSGSVPRS